MEFRRALPCDLCDEPAAMQIITVVFDGSSPADQLLCPAHAPQTPALPPNRSNAATGCCTQAH